MVVVSVGTPMMTIPFIGTINFGVFYALLIVPLMMTFIVDSTNMYGGMNGLEAGLSVINASAIVLYVVAYPFISGQEITTALTDSGTVAASLLGASIAFFYFNRYPAKVLPGDVGRLPFSIDFGKYGPVGNHHVCTIPCQLPSVSGVSCLGQA